MQPSNEREAVPFLQTSWPSSKVLFRSLCLQTCGFISAAESPWHVLIPFPYIFLLPCPPPAAPVSAQGARGAPGRTPAGDKPPQVSPGQSATWTPRAGRQGPGYQEHLPGALRGVLCVLGPSPAARRRDRTYRPCRGRAAPVRPAARRSLGAGRAGRGCPERRLPSTIPCAETKILPSPSQLFQQSPRGE